MRLSSLFAGAWAIVALKRNEETVKVGTSLNARIAKKYWTGFFDVRVLCVKFLREKSNDIEVVCEKNGKSHYLFMVGRKIGKAETIQRWIKATTLIFSQLILAFPVVSGFCKDRQGKNKFDWQPDNNWDEFFVLISYDFSHPLERWWILIVEGKDFVRSREKKKKCYVSEREEKDFFLLKRWWETRKFTTSEIDSCENLVVRRSKTSGLNRNEEGERAGVKKWKKVFLFSSCRLSYNNANTHETTFTIKRAPGYISRAWARSWVSGWIEFYPTRGARL